MNAYWMRVCGVKECVELQNATVEAAAVYNQHGACHGPAVCKTKALHAMDQAQAPMSALRHNHMLERSPFLDAMLRSGERSVEVYFLRTRQEERRSVTLTPSSHLTQGSSVLY